MTFVVTEACIKCKLTDCVEVCPVDCFHEGPNFLVIDPDECIDSLVNWAGEAAVERKQARQVLDVTLSILISPNNTQKKLGLNVEKDWASAMELFKEYKDLETDKKPTDFFTNEFID